jgi:hypothetical protein
MEKWLEAAIEAERELGLEFQRRSKSASAMRSTNLILTTYAEEAQMRAKQLQEILEFIYSTKQT